MGDAEEVGKAPEPDESRPKVRVNRVKQGRPPKANPETLAKVLEAIRAGAFFSAAAPYAGIGRRTLDRYLEIGRDAKSGPMREFWLAAEKALADSELRATLVVSQAITGEKGHSKADCPDPEHHDTCPRPKQAGDQGLVRAAKIALAYLERRFSRRWGRRTTLKGDGPGGAIETSTTLNVVVRQSNPVDSDGRIIVPGAAVAPQLAAVAPQPPEPEAPQVAPQAPPAPEPAKDSDVVAAPCWSRSGKAQSPFPEPPPKPVPPKPVGAVEPPRFDD